MALHATMAFHEIAGRSGHAVNVKALLYNLRREEIFRNLGSCYLMSYKYGVLYTK